MFLRKGIPKINEQVHMQTKNIIPFPALAPVQAQVPGTEALIMIKIKIKGLNGSLSCSGGKTHKMT